MSSQTLPDNTLSARPTGSGGADLLASVVVFLVALPLCMGIAIASGAPVAAGLITGIVGGILVGTLAGSPLQVSGPAAGLTVVVYEIIRNQGYEAFGIVVLVAGLIQIAAGLLRVGLWFRAVPPVVVEGMLGGIGILIMAGQFHVMVDDAPKGSGWQNLLAIPHAIQVGLPLPKTEPKSQRVVQAEMLNDFVTLQTSQRRIDAKLTELMSPTEGEATESAAQAMQMQITELSTAESSLAEKIAAWQLRLTKLPATDVSAERREQTSHDLQVAQSSASELATALASTRVSPDTLLPLQKRATDALAQLANGQKDHAYAGKLGFATIVIMLLWQCLPIKKLKIIPAPLVAITIVTLFAYFYAVPVIRVDVPANLANEIHLPTWSTVMKSDWRQLLISGAVVALIASAETLLCCTAVDQMHSGPRTKYDRELMAQGCGNLTCGLFNALPMTGVIVRSAANVQAGAKSRRSAILHGVWLLLFAVFLTPVLRAIPTAALAAMLVYTGARLIKLSALREFWHLSRVKIAIYVATAAVIVLEDLLTGVVFGIVLSAIRLLWRFSWFDCQLVENSQQARRYDLTLRGSGTFMGIPRLVSALDKVPPSAELHVHIDQLSFIDHACLEALTNWEKSHVTTGGVLVLDWETLTARFRHTPETRADAQLAASRGAGRA